MSTRYPQTNTESPTDIKQRQQAIDISRSIAVSAPAGSGKTELLIQRVLHLLANCQRPEQVLVITFTRKTATEMRQRIIDALIRVEQKIEVEGTHQLETHRLATAVWKQSRRQSWQLLTNTHRLQVQTIDSLCRFIAHNTGFNGGLIPADIVDDENLLYQQSVSQLLATHLPQASTCVDHSCADALAKLLVHCDNDIERLSRMLCDLLKRRAYLGQDLQGQVVDIANLHQNFIDYGNQLGKQLHCLLGPYLGELQDCINYAQPHLDIIELPTELVLSSPTIAMWKALIDTLLLTGTGEWRKQLNKKNGFPVPKKGKNNDVKERMRNCLKDMQTVKGLLPLLQQLKEFPGGNEDDDQQWHILEAIILVLPHLIGDLSKLSQSRGECDYTTVSLAALAALQDSGTPTDLALRLDYRIQHILVDEFQDTSSIQIRLLELLTAGWQEGDGRTLFIVGDAMQSIYRFRNANVELFQATRQRGINDVVMEPIDINANFRSQLNLVKWVNETFTAMPLLSTPSSSMPLPSTGGQSATPIFYPSVAVKPVLTGEAVTLKSYAEESAEAQDIATVIETILAQNKGDSIAILVRNRSHLKALLPVLAERKINWQGNDIATIMESLAVVNLHCLTRLLHNPADRLAWLGFLRSPLCGLNQHDLFYLCHPQEGDEPWLTDGYNLSFIPIGLRLRQVDTIARLSAEAQTIIKRINPTLQWASAQYGHLPLRQVIETCWHALGGFECYECANGWIENPQLTSHSDSIQTYLQTLESCQHAGIIGDWQAFDQLLKKTTNPTDSRQRLQIMTLHKAKGLEFDHVFIPALEKTSRNDDEQLLRWWLQQSSDGSQRLLISPKAGEGQRNAYYDYLKWQEKQFQQQELCRLLYVGCTRAIKYLHLSAVIPTDCFDDDKPNPWSPSKGSLLNMLWSPYAEQFKANYHYGDVEEQLSHRQETSRGLWRLPSDFQSTLELHSSPSISAHGDCSTMDSPVDIDQEYYRYRQQQMGILLHRQLHTIVLEGIHQWQPNALRRQRQQKIWETILAGQGFDNGERQSIIAQMERGIDTMLSDPRGRWILSGDHSHSHCELSLNYCDTQGYAKTLVIDRTFVSNDICWIIDYKSTEPSKDQSQQDFFCQQRNQYRPQLNTYEQALRSYQVAKDYRQLLYFPLLGTACEL